MAGGIAGSSRAQGLHLSDLTSRLRSTAPRRPIHGCPQRQHHACQASSAASADVTTQGLVFRRGGTGAWDEAAVGSPVVRCYIGDNSERWFMWYSGCAAPLAGVHSIIPAAGSIGVATSSDGVVWRRGTARVEGSRGADAEADVGCVLQPNSDQWWALDTCHLSVSDVQVMSNASVTDGVGVYWMFYTGGDFEPLAAPPGLPGVEGAATVEGLRMRLGLAMSQDGRNWARIEGEHHTGAVLDVGQPGAWDEVYVSHPQVVAAGPKDLRMFYHSFDAAAQRFAVGLATSPDGFRWARQGQVFCGGGGEHDARGVAACHVMRDPDSKRFIMFYEAVAADNARSIGIAVSADGRRNWQAALRPILSASADPDAWDAGGVGAPCGVPMSAGRWRLYYAGRRTAPATSWDGIGLALSPEGVDIAGAATAGGLQFTRRKGQAPANASGT